MNLRVKPNDGTGLWEVHDECGFLCRLESESTAALIVHSVNVLPEMVAALKLAEPAVAYHHSREGCPVTRKAVRAALRKTHHINPPPAFAGSIKKKGTIP